MNDQGAFRILGLEPTVDEHVVRAAFVRLARIYHPDRFIDQPPDVQAEAHQRMQGASSAYTYLRARIRHLRTAQPNSQIKHDPWADAQRYRDSIARRYAAVLEQKARHARWDDLEKQAMERARREAELAASLGEEDLNVHHATDRASMLPERTRSRLEIRLREARANQRR
jgi:hypothetical protein